VKIFEIISIPKLKCGRSQLHLPPLKKRKGAKTWKLVTQMQKLNILRRKKGIKLLNETPFSAQLPTRRGKRHDRNRL